MVVARGIWRRYPTSGYPFVSFPGIHGEAVIAFSENRAVGIGDDIALALGAATRRLTRSFAYSAPASLPSPAQGSLLARAGYGLLGISVQDATACGPMARRRLPKA